MSGDLNRLADEYRAGYAAGREDTQNQWRGFTRLLHDRDHWRERAQRAEAHMRNVESPRTRAIRLARELGGRTSTDPRGKPYVWFWVEEADQLGRKHATPDPQTRLDADE